jgi:hypothetical protein
VAELEPTQFSPGQPSTYVSLLKRIAVELSPGGIFKPSSSQQSVSANNNKNHSKLIVSEAWCLYSRPKPSSVWARDATALADQLMHPTSSSHTPFARAAWSLTHGPGALQQVVDHQKQLSLGTKSSGLVGWWRKTVSWEETPPETPAPRRPLFPLSTSESQNRIADLLLNQDYPAVVTEGPPGTGYVD